MSLEDPQMSAHESEDTSEDKTLRPLSGQTAVNTSPSSSSSLPPYSPARTDSTTTTIRQTDTRADEDYRILRLACLEIEQNAMEHLKTSLITTIAVWDEQRAYYASDFNGKKSIYRVVGRFRRHRPGKTPIDLCLVLWKEMYISEREKAHLRDTHRYRIKEICGPDEKLDIVRIKWCASWEPAKNLPRHLQGLDEFSAHVKGARAIGDDIPNFEINVGSYDAGPYCCCDLHPFDA
ncbi:hypothetical protein TWF569_008957 [Orbilia oligospora]|uniref:Uncharacterized protein n=1 Tax=Orbilia oligospora TaxID=2813651 RepID=A0A7C8NK13_ORBOL|nr:hypothetical protein TWF102_010563 [Orbilia oligospora]KAF3105831.1 hypothetical protein TWF103_006530 [Orbilia oligospora]KAF3155588.1 hypothetical protein TWF569_008957 [Orbilia oligospora]